MNVEKLKTRREKLVSQIKEIDAALAKAERAAREQEQRELVKLIQSRGLTVAQLSQLLNTPATASTVGDSE